MGKQRVKQRERRAPVTVAEVNSISSHFLDSGAFTMWTSAHTYAKENRCGEWDFYDTDIFYQYMENYAKFVKKYHKGIDLYATVDAMPFHLRSKPPKGKTSQELSYRNQKYLESLGTMPVPVVHNGTDPSEWLVQYIEDGYPLIGLGGMAGKRNKHATLAWLDKCFDYICPNGKPIVNIHGFGVTSYSLLLRYPWYSVDSTSWTKKGGFGQVMVPRYRGGKFIFTPEDLMQDGMALESLSNTRPWTVYMSMDHRTRFDSNALHYFSCKSTEKRVMDMWFEKIGVPVGTSDENDREGLINHHSCRRHANLFYFEHLRQGVLRYRKRVARLWRSTGDVGFGLHRITSAAKQPDKLLPMHVPDVPQPIIYYSGVGSTDSLPEVVLGERANVMLTYHFFSKKNKPDARFARILRGRGHKF